MDSAAKRMKLAAPVIYEEAPLLPAVAAAEATDPAPATAERSQVPAPGADEDGGEELLDRLSDLPDGVLCEIISFLPVMDGARTQILAPRWRHLWRAAPLNLDFRSLPAADNRLSARCLLVGVILAAHQGPGRRLCLPGRHLQYRADVVDGWLRSRALDNLQELEFYFNAPSYCSAAAVIIVQTPLPPLPPPASVFRFSPTLRVATLSNCYLLDQTVQGLHFPQLRKLALIHVEISEVSLHTIVSAGCPGLECLLLSAIPGIRCLEIESPTLRSIGIRSTSEELIIKDAPSLERLLYLEMHMRMQISVISAPKLEALGCIPQSYSYSKIIFGSTVIKGLRIDSLITVVRTVKILAIHLSYFNLDMVIDLMRCFPCLEKLYVKEKGETWEPNSQCHKESNLLTSLDIRLRTIVLRCYRGTQLQDKIRGCRWRRGHPEVLGFVLQQAVSMMFQVSRMSMIWV
uniref:Uncharacterized protein n=1 Tax=Avena sativa TaxID=4498 RepID=A0ACD5U1J9_AVESA